MDLKQLLPGYGEHSTRKRIHDLEKEAGTLPVIFALFLTEGIKLAVSSIPFFDGVNGLWGGFIDAAQMFLVAIIVGLIYVYDIDLD